MCITLFLMLEKVENVICYTTMSKYVIVHIEKINYFQALVTLVA